MSNFPFVRKHYTYIYFFIEKSWSLKSNTIDYNQTNSMFKIRRSQCISIQTTSLFIYIDSIIHIRRGLLPQEAKRMKKKKEWKKELKNCCCLHNDVILLVLDINEWTEIWTEMQWILERFGEKHNNFDCNIQLSMHEHVCPCAYVASSYEYVVPFNEIS